MNLKIIDVDAVGILEPVLVDLTSTQRVDALSLFYTVEWFCQRFRLPHMFVNEYPNVTSPDFVPTIIKSRFHSKRGREEWMTTEFITIRSDQQEIEIVKRDETKSYLGPSVAFIRNLFLISHNLLIGNLDVAIPEEQRRELFLGFVAAAELSRRKKIEDIVTHEKEKKIEERKLRKKFK